MDDKTKPIDVYIVEPNFNISNDDIIDSNNVVDEHQWGEDGVVTQLLNIIIKEDIGIKLDG
jgi:hypothetical protein